ncbi:MAG TPA: hypothetical protein VFY89_09385, partial [Ktedonobacterales bacterium]
MARRSRALGSVGVGRMGWNDDSHRRGPRRRERLQASGSHFTQEDAAEHDPFTPPPPSPPRETAVLPALTLPTRAVPRTGRPRGAAQPRQPGTSSTHVRLPAIAPEDEGQESGKHRRTLANMPAVSAPAAPSRRSRMASFSRVLIPGGNAQRIARRHARHAARKESRLGGWLAQHRILFALATLIIVVVGILGGATEIGHGLGLPLAGRWAMFGGAGPAPTPTPRPAPDFLDAGHYVSVYGFDYPRNIQPLPADERQRLISMLPFALKATAAYDARYHARIEPELLLWWTHTEGIGARITYSNCANYAPRAGTTYFTNIQNCPHASFWQLGYGNQFSVIYVLKDAFRDMHGDPNNARLVQEVGQQVLNYDRSQGTVPTCGGYSCTFPTRTIDQIMAGVRQTTNSLTEDNWWASVLSRDPAINCYMSAHALTFFNHEATQNWVGCYYAEPCWG